METKPRFRPSIRQYRILEAANKELKAQFTESEKYQSAYKEVAETMRNLAVDFQKNGDRAIRLNWYLIALISAWAIFVICL